METEEQTNNVEGAQKESIQAPLRYMDKLTLFLDIIAEKYHTSDLLVYRTTPNSLPNETDLLPRHRLLALEQGREYKFEYTAEDVAEMEKDEREKEVSKEAVSVHKTESKEILEAKRQYKAILKSQGKDEAEAYKIKRGCYVMRLHIKEEYGLISDFHQSTKHANVLLRENVTLDDLIDQSYELKKFSYDD